MVDIEVRETVVPIVVSIVVASVSIMVLAGKAVETVTSIVVGTVT